MAKILLLLWAGLCGAFGVSALLRAQSAVHEMEGSIALLIMTVGLAGVLIVEAIDKLRADQRSATWTSV